MTSVVQIEPSDPAERLRHQIAASLRDHMAAQGVSRKRLRHLLAELDPPVIVSRQAVDQWLNGVVLPKPHHQAACAVVLRVPAHRLFPLQAA